LDHPMAFSVIWLVGLAGGVAAVTVAVRPPWPQRAARDRKRPSEAPPRKTTWPVWLARGVVVAAVLGAVWSQWRGQVAAYASYAGALDFYTGHFTAGLSDGQLAARDAAYEPTYRFELGLAFLSLARIPNRTSQALSL